MTKKIEARPYGPDSTPEEIEAIRARLTWYEPGILLWRELPVQTIFSVRIKMIRLGEMVKEVNGPITELVDLSEAGSPPQEVRAELARVYKNHDRLKKFAIITGKNFLSNVFARFISSLIGFSATFHQTLEEAAAELKKP